MAGGVAGKWEGAETSYGTTLSLEASDTNNTIQGNKTIKGWTVLSVLAYRMKEYDDKELYWTVVRSDGTPMVHAGLKNVNGLSTADIGQDNYRLFQFDIKMTFAGSNLFDGKLINNVVTMTSDFYPAGAEKSLDPYISPSKNWYVTFKEDNTDELSYSPDDYKGLSKQRSSKLQITFEMKDFGAGATVTDAVWHATNSTSNLTFKYPPYKPTIPGPIRDKDLSNNGSDSSDGIDIGDANNAISLTISKTYSITRANDTKQKVSWNPNGTVGPYNLGITNLCTVSNVGTSSSSPYEFTTPDIIGGSYTAWVKRYYTNRPQIQARSRTITLYTYSRPELSSISLSKSVISPRSGASIRVSLYGTNDKKHNFENTFRTCIWSPYKDPYLDYETTSTFRDLTADEVKVMFPDSNASNGEINSQVKVKRKNLGISGGNPGNGNLVYQTGTSTKNLKIQYKPTVPINPDIEPNPNDPSNSGIAYYKKEDNREGVKLTAGHTWVLPNTYDISRMNGINIRLQYPKTDASGVLSGYRIRLYSPNDGSPDSNVKYFEDHWNTTNYIDTYFISYDTLRRGISGNEIEITPYYTSSSGEKWYGPTMRKKFVDISWMLNKPVIDCPLTNTTWHNHKYRVLFKLPIDRDTNYKGINDIELHYGSGKYRYQEIQMNINGTITTFADNGFYNAHNIWNNPVNVNNANLTYLRNIIVNPSLIGTYSDKNQYIISIRIRKAYGQNPNWDGWSEWSDTITVNRKTVKNDVVNRHEYINATHYMTVQTAFNLSTACYAKKASDNSNFVVKESFDRARGDNINGPHLSPPENQPFQTIREYLSEFKDLHQLKDKINSYATFDTDKNRNPVKLDYQNNLLASFTPIQEFITAAKDQNGATECDSPATILKGRNYMKYMCDEINHLY